VTPASDLVGVGVSSIGDVAGAYAANDKKLTSFERKLGAGRLPVERGVVRTPEDELRRAVINRIICTLTLDYRWIESEFGVEPQKHFADAFASLGAMAADGLVELGGDGLRVTTAGRFFLRNLCMPFDAYLAAPGDGPVYSRTV